MTATNFTRNTPGLAQCIAAAAQAGASAVGIRTVMSAVQAGRIALTVIAGHKQNWTPRSLKSSLPTIVLISDDDDAVETRNPDEWRCAISAIAWARGAIVHGTAARGPEYAAAVTLAGSLGRLLLVETGSRHVQAWMTAIAPRRIPALALIPKDGGVHPDLARRERVA
jgi:hypothetical protein